MHLTDLDGTSVHVLSITSTDAMLCTSEERHGDSSQAAAEEGAETTGQAIADIVLLAGDLVGEALERRLVQSTSPSKSLICPLVSGPLPLGSPTRSEMPNSCKEIHARPLPYNTG